MRTAPYKFLAVVIAIALPVAFCRRAPDPNQPAEPLSPEMAAAAPDTVVLRLAAKEQIAREVADGRRTLWVAAALFRELNRLPPEPAKPSRIVSPVNIPVDTEEGWLCRQVVEGVRVALHQEPERAAAVVARLEAEFFAELRRHGVIRLPEPSSLESVPELLAQARASLAEQQRRAILGPRLADR
jgi:hypothetical protein